MARQAMASKGFTLIELMIGITVLAIALAIGVPSYATWIQNTRLRNAAESISSGLQIARSEAVSRNVSVNFALANAGSGWTVGCTVVTATCPAVLQTRSAGDGSSAAVTVQETDARTVTFNNLGRMNAPVPAGGASFTAFNVDIDPAVMTADKTRELRVTVGIGGTVRMCDPSVADATDSRACPA